MIEVGVALAAVKAIAAPVTGLLGGVLTSHSNYKLQVLKNEQDDKSAAHELQRMDMEHRHMLEEQEANLRLAQVDNAAKVDMSELQITAANLEQANKNMLDAGVLNTMLASKSGMPSVLGAVIAFMLGLVDVLKGLVRPTLTLYFVGMTSWLTWLSYRTLEMIGGAMSPDTAQQTWLTVVDTCLYLAVTCTTWWFYDRRHAKYINRLSDGNLKKA